MGKMSQKKMREVISKAWSSLERKVYESHNGEESSLLHRAFDASMKVEKDHRNYVKRYDSGRGYNLSVVHTAQSFVLRELGKENVDPPESWKDAASIRSDILYSRALREVMGRFHVPEIDEIDYPRDVAGLDL